MLCNSCGTPLPDKHKGLVCARCAEEEIFDDIELNAQPDFQKQEQSPGSRAGSLQRDPRVLIAAIGGLVILFLSLLLLSILSIPTGEKLPPFELRASESTPCEGKDYCFYVYVADWSLTSEASIPAINAVAAELEEHPRAGLAVIIGGGSLLARKNFAESITAPTFFDSSRSFHRAAEVRYFPSWTGVDLLSGRTLCKIEANSTMTWPLLKQACSL